MNRNTELHFANLPDVDISRSKFDRSYTHKLTFDAGKLIPIYCDATIMPGDTVKMGLSEVVRMMTPICPVMDNAYMDVYFFFVPHRIVHDNFKKFMGENDTAPWVSTYDGKIPKLKAPTNDYAASGHKGWTKGTIADYFGIPTEVTNFSVNALPFRAYVACWNEFFRDENIMYPQQIFKDDTERYGITIGAAQTSSQKLSIGCRGGEPLPVCKLHDYFTSCLPNSQKGQPVSIPIGGKAEIKYANGTGVDNEVEFEVGPFWNQTGFNQTNTNNYVEKHNVSGLTYNASYGVHAYAASGDIVGTSSDWTFDHDHIKIYTDLSAATGATVNQLRQAFAIQKFMERDARNGTRFIENIRSHFNVTNPDYRLARPEYLGGKRIPINMNTVVQNSPTTGDDITPLGTTGAYSVTSDSDEDLFTKSFTEWGTLLGLICVRTDRTYQQGLNRQWSMSDKYDFYWPEFANLGEEFVANKEIYLQGSDVVDEDGNIIDEQAFGYQERWANYRYMPDQISGELRSNYAQSLDVWHYADYYTELPTLSDTWLKEDKANISRTLAVQDHDQFIGDFFFKAIYTRPMPMYSVPGLIDHH